MNKITILLSVSFILASLLIVENESVETNNLNILDYFTAAQQSMPASVTNLAAKTTNIKKSKATKLLTKLKFK
jgi:hypothetical protein